MEPTRRPAWSWTRRSLAIGAVLLVTAVIAAFGGAVGNGSILLDDPEYVWANPVVREGLTWTGFTWCFSGVHGGNWHPLTSLTHLLDVEMFDLDPAGPHAVNVGLHALAAVLLFAALARILRSYAAAGVVALIFAVHPLRVESVAWIAERKDVLSGAFFALVLGAYASWIERPIRARYVTLVGLFALGLLAKPMLVTLPFLLVLLDFWPFARLSTTGELWPRVREKLPLFGLSCASMIVTYAVQRSYGAMQTAESIPFTARLANAPIAIVRYVGTFAWPANLSPYYPFELSRDWIAPVASSLAIALATLGAWRARRASPWVLVGWLWFLGLLVPVIGLVQVGGQSRADRYTYLPQIGLGLAIVLSMRACIARQAALRAPLFALLAVLVGGWIWAARAQVERWRDSRTLAEHMLEVADGLNPLAHMLLANSVIGTDPVRARAHFEAALALVPALPKAHSGLGFLAAGEKRWHDAEREFRAELAVRPTAQAHYNLALVEEQLGRPAEAIRSFEDALRIDPDFRPALDALTKARGNSTPEATR